MELRAISKDSFTQLPFELKIGRVMSAKFTYIVQLYIIHPYLFTIRQVHKPIWGWKSQGIQCLLLHKLSTPCPAQNRGSEQNLQKLQNIMVTFWIKNVHQPKETIGNNSDSLIFFNPFFGGGGVVSLFIITSLDSSHHPSGENSPCRPSRRGSWRWLPQVSWKTRRSSKKRTYPP